MPKLGPSSRQPHESERAIAEAQEHLTTTAARSHEVRRVATSLKDIRDRNHFAEQIHAIMTGNPRKGKS